jgi:O-antigen/teichoic acid export membrane protein
MNLGLKKLSLNVGSTLVRQIFAGFLNLGTVVIIARFYGPEGNGAFAVALLLPSMLNAFLNLGVAPANVYFLGSGILLPREALVASSLIWCGASFIGLAIGAGILNLASARFFSGVETQILWFALAIFPVSLFTSYLQGIFQGLQKFGPYNLLAITQPTLLLALTSILVVLGNQEIALLVAAQLVVTILVFVLALYLLIPHLGKERMISGYFLTVKKILSYGWRVHLSNILAFVNYKADIFISNYFLGTSYTGIYTIAVSLAEKLWILSQSVSTVLLPRLAELHSDESRRKKLTPLIARWTLIITLVLASGTAIAANWLIEIIFGAQYRSAVLPFWLLLPGIVAFTLGRILSNDIAARGHPEVNMYISIISVTINIVGNILLIPTHGLAGAAISTSLAYILSTFLIIISYCRFTGVDWKDTLFPGNSDWQSFKKLWLK